MTPAEHGPAAHEGGIHDTGELARLWDALEALARRVDERAARGPDDAAEDEAAGSDAREPDGHEPTDP